MKKQKTGKLIIVSAPSGAGKTTIVRHLMTAFPNLVFSVSACSRPPRPQEVDGRDYHFMKPSQFQEHIGRGDFVEWEEVYPGNYYGTLKSEVESKLAEGKDVIFDVDVKGGLSIKAMYGEKALAIFIMPPSVGHLEERLQKRSTEDEQSLLTRLSKAEEEIEQSKDFDAMILNDTLPHALKKAEELVSGFLCANG